MNAAALGDSRTDGNGDRHMTILQAAAALCSLILMTGVVCASEEPLGTTGSSESTIINGPPSTDGDCEVFCHHDDSLEGGFCWQFGGAAPPDYGAWAECYEGAVWIREIHLYFTQTGYYTGQTMDVYIWEDDGTGLPGAVAGAQLGVSPGPIDFWPTITRVELDFSLEAPESHWIGFWGNWPDEVCAWYIMADQDGFPGCPATKIAPGIGYPTGWNDPNIIPAFYPITSMGICKCATEEPTPTAKATWGRIKSMY